MKGYWRCRLIQQLSILAQVAMEDLSDPDSLIGRDNELKELFTSASPSKGATNLAIVAPVQKLVKSATEN